MIIIDTSVWIEYFRGHQPYYDHVAKLLSTNEIVALSPIFGELLQGAKNNNERSIIMDFWTNLPKIQENDLFIKAGAESSRHKWSDKGVGLIDSFIITSSRETVSFVWTLDKKLQRLLKKEKKYLPTL